VATGSDEGGRGWMVKMAGVGEEKRVVERREDDMLRGESALQNRRNPTPFTARTNNILRVKSYRGHARKKTREGNTVAAAAATAAAAALAHRRFGLPEGL